MSDAFSFIPEDRQDALGTGRALPRRARGTVLAVDISGFTPMTEALVRALGARAGADAATRHLNAVYAELTAVLHQFGGSIVSFSGDGMLCWFAPAAPELEQAAAAALAAARLLQARMPAYATIRISDEATITLAVKTALATGFISRFVVGDPAIQLIDVMAGAAVDRAARGEHLAGKGQIVLDGPTRALTRRWLTRVTPTGDTQHPFAVVSVDETLPDALPDCARVPYPATPTAVIHSEQWLLPQVAAQLRHAGDRFLGEIRPAVALFARLGGLDFDGDAAAPEKFDAYIRWVQAVLLRYDGALIQLTTGDKGSYLYAAFGAPLAHDDDFGSALATAHRLCTPPNTLAYRPIPQIGIAQGRMRVGPYGSASRRTYGVQGAAVNLAARLMMQAAPGVVLTDAATAAVFAGQVAVTALPPVHLKGHDAPVALYRLELESPPPRPADVAWRAPIRGRDAHLARLHAALDQAIVRQACTIVTLTGDAGMGKSRLLGAFAARLAQDRHGQTRGVTMRAQSSERGSAYFALRRAMRELLEIDDALDAAGQAAQVAGRVAALDATWTTRTPLLGDLLDLPLAENATTAALDPRLRREALHDLACALIAKLAQAQPLALLVDDAQWLDEASLALLTELAALGSGAPLLLAIAYRPGSGGDELRAAFDARLPALSGGVTNIALDGLSQTDMTAHLEMLLDGPLDALGAAFIWQQSQGNPFMAEALAETMHRGGHLRREPDGCYCLAPEVLETLRQAGVLVATGTGEVLQAGRNDLGLNLPTSLHGLVLAQVDRLPEPAKLTLKIAATLGPTFAQDVLAGAHPRRPDATALAADLGQLVASGFLQRDGQEAGRFAFCHTIAQEVIYRTLLDEQRRELHGRAARALQAVAPDAVAQLAHHFYHADLDDVVVRNQCLDALDRAAVRAQRDYASETALHQVDRALGLEVTWARLKRRVDLLHILGRRDEEAATLDRLAAQASAPVDVVALAQGDYFEAVSRYEEAVAAVQRARRAALATADREAHARCLARLGMIAWRQGDYAGASQQYREALRVLDDDARVAAVEADTRYGLGLVHRQQGYYDAAQTEFIRCLEIYRSQGNRPAEAKALIALGHVAHYRHDLDAAMAAYEEALAIYRETGDRAGVAYSMLSLGQVHGSMGDHARALELLEGALDRYRILDDKWSQILVHNELGVVSMMLGDLGAARTFLETGLAMSKEIGDDSGVAYTLCNLGQVLRDMGALADAQTRLLEGLALARSQADRHLEASVLQDLARLHVDTGELDTALRQATASSVIFADLASAQANVTNFTTCALVYAAIADASAKQRALENALTLLDQGAAATMAFPQREFWVCAQLSRSENQAAYTSCLQQAHAWMMRLADRISDPALRAAYLRNHPFNRDIVTAFAQHQGAP